MRPPDATCPTDGKEAYQLASDAIGRFQGAMIQEVFVAPVTRLAILLVCVVDIEQSQVVPCRKQASALFKVM